MEMVIFAMFTNQDSQLNVGFVGQCTYWTREAPETEGHLHSICMNVVFNLISIIYQYIHADILPALLHWVLIMDVCLLLSVRSNYLHSDLP